LSTSSYLVLVYPSGVGLSTSHLRHLTCHLAARRVHISCRRRRLTLRRQALLLLAHLRCGDTYAQSGAGFGVGITTVYRYIPEAVDVLAALAPTLEQKQARRKDLILDSTLLPIDRMAADRAVLLRETQETRHERADHHRPFGRLLWASPALPGQCTT
jgi:hypothetical protein